MPLSPPHQKFVDDFFAAIAPSQAAFQHIGFSYLAVKFGEPYQLIRGRVFLNTAPPAAHPQHFQSSHVRAGHYALSELASDISDLINQLLSGILKTPDGPLHFFPASGGHHATSFTPFHPDGLTTQRRFNVLTIMAGETDTIRQPEIDWEIKAASLPYDGLQELANEFSLGALTQRPPYVEVVAYNVAVVDAQNSKVAGNSADIEVLLAKGLAHDRVTLGYRVYAPGTATTRKVVTGAAMTWAEDVHFDRGRTTIQIPLAAAVNCAISYDGTAQSHYWLSDPTRIPNPRRAVYEAFDPKLENLNAIIAGAQGRGQEARDLESAVAWLLWMLGFSVAHLNTRRTREAADLLVTTPQGHFAVVECTTGLLKAENKLSILHDRAEAARRSLADSNSAHLRLLPVIVTSKTRPEITPDLETAEKLGILVMTRENLDNAINQRTLVHPNADQVYAESEQIVSAALAKYQAQETLRLDLPPAQ
jgi:hypothetical protein